MGKKTIRILKIAAGTFLLAVSVEMFIIPYNILSGGVAGIAVALEPFFHIDKTIFANVLTIGFFLMGLVILGKQFVLDSLLSTILYPVFTTLCHFIVPATNVPPAVASIYAGILGGIGIGLVMSTGASTGGVDIPTMILAKVFHVRISYMVMIVDGCTVLLGIMAYSVDAALIGLLSVFASSFAVGRVLYAGQGHAKNVTIISPKWPEITSTIQRELDRGVTLLDGTGGYSGMHTKVVLCVVSERQYGKLLDIIHEFDDKAFVITTDASDMHGEGFSNPVTTRI